MKTLLILAASLALTFSGCEQFKQVLNPPSPAPAPQIDEANSSQIVVTAEKTLRISKETFDTFLHLEKNNQEFVKAHIPQAHQFAEYLRRNAAEWLIRANNVKNLYKHNRTLVNKQTLISALNVLTENTTQAQSYIDQLNRRTP